MAMDTDESKEEKERQKQNLVPHLSCEEKEIPPLSNGVLDHINDDMIVFDDDDAAVILEELALNFGISARTPPSRGSSAALISVLTKSAASRRNSGHSPRTLLRTCMTKVLVDASLKAGKNKGHIGRLLSAKRNHIHNLSNDMVLLQRKIKELEEQNRVLTRISKRQESALKKYHDEETKLPHLLEAHKMEIKILQDKLRKATELNKKDSEKLKICDSRIIKLSDEMSRLKLLVTKKDLLDRDTLDKKLSSTLNELQDKEKEAVELNRRILILSKSFQQQIKTETSKHRTTLKKLDSLKEDYQRAVQKLTDREKQLAAIQHYRSSSSTRKLSSASLSSSTNTSASFDIPGAVSSSSGKFVMRKVSRKRTARKLTPASLSISSNSEVTQMSAAHHRITEPSPRSHDKEKHCALNTQRTYTLDPIGSCNFDKEATNVLIDLDIEGMGWTTECKVNNKRDFSAEHPMTERRNSGRLPPLDADFHQEEKKNSDSPSQFSSDAISSPDEVRSSENQSGSNDYQTSSVAIQESVSRKTTTSSSWSDETRVEEFSLSRNCSPSTLTTPQPTVSENLSNTCINSNIDTDGAKTGENSSKVESDDKVAINEKWDDQATTNQIALNDNSGEFPDTNCDNNHQTEDGCVTNFSSNSNMNQDEGRGAVENNAISEENNISASCQCPAEDRCNFSLIENYPPKERRKLENGIEPGAHNSGTNSDGTIPSPREIELPKSCDSPGVVSLAHKLRNVASALTMVGAARKNSLRRNSSIRSAEVHPLPPSVPSDNIEEIDATSEPVK